MGTFQGVADDRRNQGAQSDSKDSGPQREHRHLEIPCDHHPDALDPAPGAHHNGLDRNDGHHPVAPAQFDRWRIQHYYSPPRRNLDYVGETGYHDNYPAEHHLKPVDHHSRGEWLKRTVFPS